jgi:DNA-binding GntR family transcriptional regulator
MAIAKLTVRPIDGDVRLKDRTYRALKDAITSMNIYAGSGELRLDERQLSEDLGVSRTPVREAMARLEQEGLLRIVARKGAYVVRKTKAEILEMITVWAALESMAARLITVSASDDEIATLRRMFATFDSREITANFDEYSDTNVRFHQAIIRLGKSRLIQELADNLFLHMQSIRAATIGEDDRANRSIIDHMHIIEALEARDTELAEKLVREHTLNLAAHVEKHVDYLE